MSIHTHVYMENATQLWLNLKHIRIYSSGSNKSTMLCVFVVIVVLILYIYICYILYINIQQKLLISDFFFDLFCLYVSSQCILIYTRQTTLYVVTMSCRIIVVFMIFYIILQMYVHTYVNIHTEFSHVYENVHVCIR